MQQVYERAYRLYVVTYKICRILQSWDKLLSTSTSTEIYHDCGITVRSSGNWFCPMSSGSAVNLNKLNSIEIELLIKMLHGVWFSLQPDHETNKSPRRFQVSSPARVSTKYFPYIKGKIDWSIWNTALSILNGLESFFVAGNLIAEVNEFF